MRAGFLSPEKGNSFEYDSIDFRSSVYRDVFEDVFFREPLLNLG